MNRKGLMGRRIRQKFFKGLVLLFPTLITILILVKAWEFVDKTIGQPVTEMVIYILVNLIGIDRASIGDSPWYLTIIGFSLAALAVFMVGLMVATFIGRSTFRYFEKMFATIPVIKIIYPYAKQVTEFFANSDDKQEFDSVILVEYPRKGVYALGFVTGPGINTIIDHAGEDTVSVFMPSSPTPITGYVINIPKSAAITINIDVEEAIRFIVSGGVLIPPHQVISGGTKLDEKAHLQLETIILNKTEILKPQDSPTDQVTDDTPDTSDDSKP